MSIGKRIKELRKKHLNMNQTDFASALGLTQAAIGAYENELRNVSEPSILSICREYGVNEKWLRTGEGSVFQEAESFSLDEFAKQHDATELELNILRAYFELDPRIRKELVEHFRQRLVHDEIEEEVAAYRRELLLEKKAGEGSGASGTSNAKEA